MSKTLRAVFATAIVLAAAAPTASAQTFDFSNLKSGPTGFLPTAGGQNCTGGDLCSSDIDASAPFGGSMTYVSGPFSVNVKGFFRALATDPYSQVTAMQDHEDGYVAGSIGAGLGVYHEYGNTSDDNITFGEMLQLTFSTAVKLNQISLRAEGHNITGWIANATYQYSTDGTTWTTGLLPTGTGTVNLGLVSQNFYVRFDDAHNGTTADQFYLAGAVVSATPEPSSLALMGLGLSGLGVVARRLRRRSQQG